MGCDDIFSLKIHKIATFLTSAFRSREPSEEATNSIWNDGMKANHPFFSSSASSSATPPTLFITQQHPQQPVPSNQMPFQSSTTSASSISSQSSQSSMSQSSSQSSARSRARAGTLPSRLPPGLPIGGINNINTQVPSVPLVSLSMRSSESSLPSHMFPSQPSPSSSSTTRLNAPLLSSASNSSLNYSAQLHPQQQSRFGLHPNASSSTSSLPNVSNPVDQSAQPYDIYRSEIPFGTSSTLQQPVQQHLHQQQPQQQVQHSNASVSRLRSGSLSVLSDNSRPSLYPSPFGSSIWSSQRTSHLQPSAVVDSKRTSQTSLLNALEEGQVQDTHPSPSHLPIEAHQQTSPGHAIDPQTIDPLQPFYKELTMRTDPSRMRSYTVNNLPYGIPSYELLNDETINEHIEQQSQPQQQTIQYSQQIQMQPPHQLGSHPSPESQSAQLRSSAAFLGGSRPRAQTTAGSFDPSFAMGNSSLFRSVMTPKNAQSQGYYSAQDPMSHNIIINSFDDSSIGPTRSLWLGNIPASTTSYALTAIFSSYGTVESARVLPHKNCGFVNFVNAESAIQAKAVLNGKELFTGQGSCRVGFAKVVDSTEFEADQAFSTQEPSAANGSRAISDNNSAEYSQDISAAITSTPVGLENSPPTNASIEYSVTDKDISVEVPSIECTKSLEDIAGDMGVTVVALGADSDERDRIIASVTRALEFKDFKSEISPVPEPRPDRVYDAPALREVRKKIDSGLCGQEDIEEIALDILDEIAELSSDYVGNTVVQKLFDSCSEAVKDMMLEQIAPYLAQISVHKNGTWAAQKIIDVAGTKRQIDIIARALHPYTVHLFLDQFGNYAIQCCLKFGSPWNDFIFETMLSKFWDIAQGRFGARAMRACLESHHVSKENQRMLAAAITMHAVQLATNANGALLLTWYLDTYTAANRHSILAPKLIPNLVQLCTHKLASLTVLKVINYKSEPGARQDIFNALFNPNEDTPSSVLEQILNHSYGPTFIYKIISTPFLEGQERQNAINKIRTVLISIKALPAQGYKRLMDEVGLATRNTSGQSSSNVQQTGMSGNNNNGPPNGRIYHQQTPPPHQMRPSTSLQRTRSTGGQGSGYFPQSQGSQMDISSGLPQNNKNYGRNTMNYMNKRGYYAVNTTENMMPPGYKPMPYDQFNQMPPPMGPSSGQYDMNLQQQMEQFSIGGNGGRISPSKYQDPQQQFGASSPWQQPQHQQQQQQQQGYFDQHQNSPGTGHIQSLQYFEKR